MPGHKTTASYGSWRSPITTDLIVADTVGLDQIALDGGDVYWTEQRPTEGGRYALVRRTPDGDRSGVTPPHFNVRSRVHEYGGGAFAVRDGIAVFSHFADNQLYRLDVDGGTGPRRITPENDRRYADLVIDAPRNRLLCVREDHSVPGAEPVNTIASVPFDGHGEQQVLVSGPDFVASPRLSPDGTRLAWLSWNHPGMPWDGTELWVADLGNTGEMGNARRVAGAANESVFQPEWSPAGALHFVSDRTGWWNLYRAGASEKAEALCPMEAEFGVPQWVFGSSTYGFAADGRIICACNRQGTWSLAGLDAASGRLDPIETPFTAIGQVRVGDGAAVFTAGSPDKPTRIVRLDPASGEYETLRKSSDVAVDHGYVSIPERIEFPTGEGLAAHALFYRPANKDFAGPGDERPPLMVQSHGGPTGSASAALDLGIQYWTSRGFAVLDVDYGGSTGYGREYRERLRGRWGIVDVEDCANGARYLADRGEADGERLIVRGWSASGYTALAALTFRDTFKAGASYFGVGDLEALAKETHKFESRYLDGLVGPYPEQRDTYAQRSPIHHVERLSCPVILFQGLDDKVVPPNQAELMYQAVRDKGLSVAHVAFEGEGHGFHKAENIKRACEAELYFYSRIFGFGLPDPVKPVEIANL